MTENEILEIGFEKHQWSWESQDFTEYIKGNEELNITVYGVTKAVEINSGRMCNIIVSNCKNIEDLKQLIRLLYV